MRLQVQLHALRLFLSSGILNQLRMGYIDMVSFGFGERNLLIGPCTFYSLNVSRRTVQKAKFA